MTDRPPCLHEVDLALMAQTQEEQGRDIKEILRLVQGDNGEGLKTRLALVERAQTRAWWWLGGVSLALLAGAAGAVFT